MPQLIMIGTNDMDKLVEPHKLGLIYTIMVVGIVYLMACVASFNMANDKWCVSCVIAQE